MSYENSSRTNLDIPDIKKVVFGVLREFGLKGDESSKDC